MDSFPYTSPTKLFIQPSEEKNGRRESLKADSGGFPRLSFTLLRRECVKKSLAKEDKQWRNLNYNIAVK